MIVLAFQELDLSAEALLYSTGSTREDAWCMAVFAALGEKAVEYEKVRASLRYVCLLNWLSISRGGGGSSDDNP
jgi:hypothetical protein